MIRVKKMVSLLLIMVILFSMSSNGFANQNTLVLTDAEKKEMQKEIDDLDLIGRLEKSKNNRIQKDTKILSEYDFFIEFETTPESTLRSMGYDKKTIEQYKNFRTLYDEHVRFLSKLGVEELSNKGYTDRQIEIINNYTGTDSEISLLAASAYVDFYIDYVEYSQSANRTQSRLYLDFVWDTLPVVKMNDFIGIAWGDSWEIGGKASNIKYEYIYNSNTTKWVSPTFVSTSFSRGGAYKFKAAIDDNYYAVKEGYSIFVVSRPGVNDMFAEGRYDRQIIGWNFSFEILTSKTDLIKWVLGGFGINYQTTLREANKRAITVQ